MGALVSLFSKPGRQDYKSGQAALQAYHREGPNSYHHLQLAIDYFEKALKFYDKDHYKYPYMQLSIANAKWELINRNGTPTLTQLRQVIDHAEKAYSAYSSDLTPGQEIPDDLAKDYFTACLNLGTYHRHLFRLNKDTKAGERAIELHSKASLHPPNALERKKALVELGISESTSADITFDLSGGGAEALEESKRLLRSAMGHLEEAERLAEESKDEIDGLCLQNLGNALLVRIRIDPQNVGRDDMDIVVKYYSDAYSVEQMPAKEKPGLLLNIARVLYDRQHAGDLDKAVERTNEALRLIGKNPRDPLYVEAHKRLASIYWQQYEVAGQSDPKKLRRAAEEYEEVLPHSAGKAADNITYNLANIYCDLYFLERNGNDLKAAESRVAQAKEKFENDENLMPRLAELTSDLEGWKVGRRKPTRGSSVMVEV